MISNLAINIVEKEHIIINEGLFQLRRSRWMRYGHRASIILLFVLSLLTLLLSFVWKGTQLEFLLMSVISFLYVLFCTFQPLRRRMMFKKVYRNNKTYGSPTYFSCDDDYLYLTSEFSDNKIAWKTISEVRELDNWILLLPSMTQYIPIPKVNLNND